MRETLRERFERTVDRTGEHHRWTGAVNPQRGTGRLQVNGRQVTAHRMAWELAHGPLRPQNRVLPCAAEPTCVRIDHLRLADAHDSAAEGNRDASGAATGPRARNRKGGGSMREVRPGVWELTAAVGTTADGRSQRVYRTVRVRSATTARRELASFVAEAAAGGPPRRPEARDLTMDTAVAQFSTSISPARRAARRRRLPTTGVSTTDGSRPSSANGVFGTSTKR